MAKRKRFSSWTLVLLCLVLLLTAVIGSGFSLNFSTILDKIKGEASEDEPAEILVASIEMGNVNADHHVWSYSGKEDDYLAYLMITGLTPGKQYRIDLSYFTSEDYDYGNQPCDCDKFCRFNGIDLYDSVSEAHSGFLCFPDLNDESDITSDYRNVSRNTDFDWEDIDFVLKPNGEAFSIIPEGNSLLVILGNSSDGDIDILSHINRCNVYEVKE